MWKVLEAFNVRVSSSSSFPLSLAIVETIYLNLFTWVSTWSSGLGQMPLQLLRKGYFLCIFVVVCHKASFFSKDVLDYQSISGLSWWLKWTGIEQVYPWPTHCPYSLGVFCEDIRQDHRKKNWEQLGAWTQPCFTPVPSSLIPSILFLSWQISSFLHEKQIRVQWGGIGIQVSVECSDAFPRLKCRKFLLKFTNIL